MNITGNVCPCQAGQPTRKVDLSSKILDLSRAAHLAGPNGFKEKYFPNRFTNPEISVILVNVILFCEIISKSCTFWVEFSALF